MGGDGGGGIGVKENYCRRWKTLRRKRKFFLEPKRRVTIPVAKEKKIRKARRI